MGIKECTGHMSKWVIKIKTYISIYTCIQYSVRWCSYFFTLLSLFFIFGLFYWFVLKFTDSILCNLHSTIKPAQWVCISAIAFFNSIIYIFWYIISISFVRFFYVLIYFKKIRDCSLKHFYNSCFKMFVRQFQHLIRSSDGNYWLSFVMHAVIFLVLSMMSDFQLYTEYFRYYNTLILI